ncbi:MAG: lamin tail domain-containing protein [Chloroflexota bacterium]
MQWKRILFYLLINVVISASTMLIVLNVWESKHAAALEQAALPLVIPTAEPVNNSPQVPVPTAAPSIPLQPYKVQPDETISEIALAFDIDIETLLEINGKMDADSIGVGEVIYVPAPTEASAQDTQAPQANTDTPLADDGVGQIKIESVIGVGDLATERIVLKNIGQGRQLLTGWQLLDEQGNIYTFSQTNLYENGAMILSTRAGSDTALELFWGLSDAAWEIGEVVTLINADGLEIDNYQIP